MGYSLGKITHWSDHLWSIHFQQDIQVHPGRLTWNLKSTHLERKMIFQTSMIMFHVNLQGCSSGSESLFSNNKTRIQVVRRHFVIEQLPIQRGPSFCWSPGVLKSGQKKKFEHPPWFFEKVLAPEKIDFPKWMNNYGWWQLKYVFFFTPRIGEDVHPFWPIFFKGVGSTTN